MVITQFDAVIMKTQGKVALLGVEVQVSFFLMSVSLRGRKMGMKSKTPSTRMTSGMEIILQTKKKTISEMI